MAFQCGWDGAALEVTAGEVVLGMRAGPGRRIPMARLRSIPAARWVEGPVARALLGVRVFGTSPSGVREWYRADRYRPVVAARAALQGRDLGSLRRFGDPTRFGFSEPPRRPSIVHVRPLLLDPTGDLERLLVRLGVRGPGGTPR